MRRDIFNRRWRKDILALFVFLKKSACPELAHMK